MMLGDLCLHYLDIRLKQSHGSNLQISQKQFKKMFRLEGKTCLIISVKQIHFQSDL